jgi:hypothetical protein
LGSIRSVLNGPGLVRFAKVHARSHWKPLVFTAWAVGVLVAYLGQFSDSLDGIRDVLNRIFGGA